MSVFSRVGTVLDYGPRRFRQSGAGAKTVWLLFPAYTRHVLMREEERRSLDVFEAHVLRLCRAGARSYGVLAALLMPPDEKSGHAGAVSLATRIVARLQAAGLLDRHLAPTAKSEQTQERPVPRYAGWRSFQDAWTGAMWDRFADPQTGLAEVVDERTRHEARLMTIRRDFSRARDQKPVRPLGGVIVLSPGAESEPAPPPSEEIERRYADWTSVRARADRFRAQAEGSLDEDDRRPAALAGIDEIGEAEPVLLLTFAYAVAEEGARWAVADPFGLGNSQSLRERLLLLLAEPGRDGLKAAIDKLDQREAGPAPQGELQQAEASVDAAVGAAVRGFAHLRDELVTMQFSAQRVAELAGRNKLREARGDIRTAIATAQVVLEWVFKLLAERFDPRGAYAQFALVQGDRGRNAEELSRVATLLGFTGPFPGRLLYVDLRKIVSACDYREGSLNAQLWAAVLAAARETRGEPVPHLAAPAPVHPLRQAGRTYPGLVMDVSDVAELRDNLNHAVTRPELYADRVPWVVGTVYRVVNAVLLGAAVVG